MKNMKKKGFTIVELVIVIAVIAILAAVLVPTFAGVVEEANKSNATQQAANAWKVKLAEILAETPTTEMDTLDGYVSANGYYFKVTDGQFDATSATKGDAVPEGWDATDNDTDLLA